MNKVCNKCKIEKDTSEFYLCKGKIQSSCKLCQRECNRKYSRSEHGKFIMAKIRNSDKYWNNSATKYNRAKAAVKQKKQQLLLTQEEYMNIINLPCHYCGNLLNNEKNRGVGLDRIDNLKTYEPDNVLSCCGFCNKTRGDRLSVIEMEEVAKLLIEFRKNNTL